MPVFFALIALFPAVSLLLFLLPRQKGLLKGWLAQVISLAVMAGSWHFFIYPPLPWQLEVPGHFPSLLHNFSPFISFSAEGITPLLGLITGTLLPILISAAIKDEKKMPSEDNFFAWLILLAGLCFAVFTASHIYMLLFLWGLAGIPLFMLAGGNTEGLASTGKKTLILFGSAHGLMATGAVMAVALSSTPFIGEIRLDASLTLHRVSFLLLLSGALMATGIAPLHGWVGGFGRFATRRAIAIIPFTLMRLLGLYLLIILNHNLFVPDAYSRLLLFTLALLSVASGLAGAFSAKSWHIKATHFHIAAGGLALLGIAAGTTAGILAAVILATGASVALSLRTLFFEPANGEWAPTEKRSIWSALIRMETYGYSDLYQLGARFVFSLHRPLSRLHDGVLQTYLVWAMAALAVLFLLNGILYGH